MLKEQSLVTRAIWLLLALDACISAFEQRWSLVFIALVTLALSMVPVFVARWAEIRVPRSFMALVVLFIAATLFLGEAENFYERFWWWDILLHGGSAIGFGMIGVLLVIWLFQRDRYAAPPWAVAFFGFCFAVMIGTTWEIFEFTVDQTLGTNMQKSGLMDTMGDLIIDMVGAALGALSGFAYLKGQQWGGITGIFAEFLSRNPKIFRRRSR